MGVQAVLMSIQPKWCELIASGKKTVEVRKTKPKIATPFKCYIYETNWQGNTYWKNHHKGKLGKVIGEFVCDKIVEFENSFYEPAFGETSDLSCVGYDDLAKYLGKKDYGYGWHISDLVIYDKPKELSEFYRHDNSYDNAFGWAFEDREKNIPITRPPQSWCYAVKGD